NASCTVAFAGLAPAAAAQDAPAAARPPVAGRPRGTARRRRPDPQWPSDREGRGDALLLGGAEKQGLPGNRGRLAPPTPPGPPPTASPGTPANPVRKISRLIAESLRSGSPAPHRCLARLVPGRRSRRAVSNRPRPRPGPSPSPRSAPAQPGSPGAPGPAVLRRLWPAGPRGAGGQDPRTPARRPPCDQASRGRRRPGLPAIVGHGRRGRRPAPDRRRARTPLRPPRRPPLTAGPADKRRTRCGHLPA